MGEKFISSEKPTAVDAMMQRMDLIVARLIRAYKEDGYKTKSEMQEKLLAHIDQLISSRLEKGTEKKGEQLNIIGELSLWINELFQERLLREDEADWLLETLREHSQGKDRLMTLHLLLLLSEIDIRKEVSEAMDGGGASF